MPAPIALQLYSLRERLNAGYAAGVRKVAEIGFVGVETAGFPGITPQAAAELFRELGLTVCSAHSSLPLGDRQAEVLDTLAALGCTRLICPWMPPERFASLRGIRQVCDELNAANAVARGHGLTLSYHNHWAECALVDGRRVYEILLDYLAPDIFFEVDTYWAQTAAGAGATEWLIVEIDRCATDMFEAVAKSYRYMVGKGLAHGKRN
jgi:sugar phosphate isomerase/epimerase